MLKNKISVLIVDDEIDICEMVAEILKDEGYNAITANSYEIAVEILKNQNITLLITDIWMNNNTNSGLELLSWSKLNDSFLPVIMMSGHGNIETAMKAAPRKQATLSIHVHIIIRARTATHFIT